MILQYALVNEIGQVTTELAQFSTLFPPLPQLPTIRWLLHHPGSRSRESRALTQTITDMDSEHVVNICLVEHQDLTDKAPLQKHHCLSGLSDVVE